MSDDRPRNGVLTGGEAVAFDRWQASAVGPDRGAPRGAPGMSVGNLEALQKEAWEEAYAQGLQEGRSAGEKETRSQAERFAGMLNQLARPFEALDECVTRQVVQLAMIVARRIVRREFNADPSHIIGVVRDALGALPIATRDVRVRLHPDDAELVRRHLKRADGERAWRVIEDPVLARGGCRVETESSRIDASVESRLAAMLAAIVGDEREGCTATGVAQESS